MVWRARVSAAWQGAGSTPLFMASQNGHVEVGGAGAAVNQARVREDWGGCWCSGVRGLLDVGSQHERAALLLSCVCLWLLGVHGVREMRCSCSASSCVPKPLMLSSTR